MVQIVNGSFSVSLEHALAEAKLLKKPGFRLVGRMEKVLTLAYLDTQAKTHIITGSLKASGKTKSDFDGNTWSGQIKYGGASAGPNNPVDYAIYEMARGGDHDFFRDLPKFEDEFTNTIEQYLLPKELK